ncbi:hypothetical protein FHX37_4634 [Haloactinospora alba]|uniref:Uncharacterized protein n=1 Tax=Haloactinospora alba TaxID=405555 RepID=A0A543N2Q3_9ACTN|nr:hypothetical protein [Haloactinospora alba]TQN26096.1 hypothetical protein FHX37_4634 [Haloactinospora alba]
MPLYELRRNGTPVERVRTVPGGFEDTRLGLMVRERSGTSGWHRIDSPERGEPDGARDTD